MGINVILGRGDELIKLLQLVMTNNSIATYQSNTTHPILTSQTKYSHQFPKTARFIAKNPQCPQAFYTFQSQLSHRMTSIGFGKKSDFTHPKSESPPPTHYLLKSIFSQKKKGRTFGCAREKSPDRSYLIPQIQAHPGPGQYDRCLNTIMHQKYSIRSKTINLTQKHSNRYTPGPAAYQSIDFQKNNGRTQLSKYGDTKLAKINPHTQRFPQLKLTPGPSSYQHQDGSMQKGQYVLSHHNGKGGRVFNRQARFTSSHWKPSQNPGPSNYQIPTQFRVLYGKNSMNRTIHH